MRKRRRWHRPRLIFSGLGIVFFVLALAARGGALAAEDDHIVKLRNGSILRGRVITFDGRDFTIILAGTRSRAIIAVEDVESIDFGQGREAEHSQPVPPETTAAPLRQAEEQQPAKIPTPPPQSPSLPPSAQLSPPAASSAVSARPQPAPAEGFVKQAPPIAEESPARSQVPLLPQFRETTVTVLAAEGNWQDTGLDVRKGHRIRISATGRIRISPTQFCGPEGIELKDPAKMMAQNPSGGLIAVIGDDNDDFIFVGPATEIIARRNGRLFLMVNDSRYEDNSGELTVKIQVEEPPGKQP